MYNIIVCCNSAISTSMFVAKMKEEAKEEHIKALIWSAGQSGVEIALGDADVVLLAPQVHYYKDRIQQQDDRNIPILLISQEDFANMNAKKVLNETVKVLENKK